MDTFLQGQGQAHGKIILMGEHAVVYGQPAIALPFPKTTITTEINPNEEALILDCQFYQGALQTASQELKSIKTIIRAVIDHLALPNQLTISIKSSILAERGMGSSAAVAVATVRALYDYANVTLNQSELLDWVGQAEKIAHGNPSGIDAAATSGNHPLYYQKNSPIEVFPMKLTNATLIVADTGIKGKTREAVADVAHLLDINAVETTARITTLGQLTEASRQAILLDQSKLLGESMNDAHEILRDLTVSNEQLDAFAMIARNAGAVGAKLTGGGRGGCLIALSDDPENTFSIQLALKEAGAVTTWMQQLGVQA